MTKSVIQPLESYRLAQYAVPIPCYICDEDNPFDAELCQHCQAPMALAHQAKRQKTPPRMIAVVGASGGGQDRLPRHADGHALAAAAAAAGAGPRRVLDHAAADHDGVVGAMPVSREDPERAGPLELGPLPGPPARATASRSRLIMPDMAGEAMLEEIDHPYTYRVIHAFLKKCAGVMALVDAVKLDRGTPRTRLLHHEAVELPGGTRRRPEAAAGESGPSPSSSPRPTSATSASTNPAAFARSHATGLWQQCDERFSRHRFFAAGVAGACVWRRDRFGGRVSVPLRIEPRGIVEPFEWLLEQTDNVVSRISRTSVTRPAGEKKLHLRKSRRNSPQSRL